MKTIKDDPIQVMPPHDNHNHSLREMNALLKELHTLNEMHTLDAHDLDHLGYWGESTVKSLTNKVKSMSKMSKIGKAQDIWRDAPDAKKNEIMVSTLHRVALQMAPNASTKQPGWDAKHVLRLKEAIFTDKDVAPLWIMACNDPIIPTQPSTTPLPDPDAAEDQGT